MVRNFFDPLEHFGLYPHIHAASGDAIQEDCGEIDREHIGTDGRGTRSGLAKHLQQRVSLPRNAVVRQDESGSVYDRGRS